MAYHHPSYNPSTAQYTAGDVEATFEYIANSDTPSYAVRFYSETEHEQVSNIKYRGNVGYDKGMNNFIEALKGAPLEAYLPVSFGSMDNGSASPSQPVAKIKTEIAIPEKIKKEIEAAQNQLKKREDRDKDIVFRETVVEELFLRRVRQREVRVRKK